MPKGVKKACKSPGCSSLQEGFNECYLCVAHGVKCLCAFHRRKRRQNFAKERERELQARKKPKIQQKPRALRAQPEFDDGGFGDDPDLSSDDDEHNGTVSLDTDGLDFLQKLQNPVRWTRVESDCLCFPDIVLREGVETELDGKSFVHVYRLTRTWGSVERRVITSDCGCEYARLDTAGRVRFKLTYPGGIMRRVRRWPAMCSRVVPACPALVCLCLCVSVSVS